MLVYNVFLESRMFKKDIRIKNMIRWIDLNNQACYPVNIKTTDDREYVEKINQHMKHKCSEASNGCINKDGFCKRGYSTMSVRETTFDKRGYPVYGKKLRTIFE
jgi:hypothetical protein